MGLVLATPVVAMLAGAGVCSHTLCGTQSTLVARTYATSPPPPPAGSLPLFGDPSCAGSNASACTNVCGVALPYLCPALPVFDVASGMQYTGKMGGLL